MQRKVKPAGPHAPPIEADDVLDYAWRMFDHLTSQIQYADTKASLILGADAILLGSLAATVADRITRMVDNWYSTVDLVAVILLTVALLLLGGSIYYALIVTRPAMGRPHSAGLFYFGMMRVLERDDFIQQFENLTIPDVRRDLLSQVYTLSNITHRKFRRNAVALNLLLGGLYLWALGEILRIFV